MRRTSRPRSASFDFKKRAHIIGVVVSDTARETAIAIASTTANSRKRRPTIPPIRRMGMKTAISDVLIDSTVNPISREPSSAASRRDLPAST